MNKTVKNQRRVVVFGFFTDLKSIITINLHPILSKKGMLFFFEK